MFSGSYLLTISFERRALARKVQGQKTTLDEAEIQEKRNVLTRRLEAWLAVRDVYIREGSQDDHRSLSTSARPELTPLRLPSALTQLVRDATCLFGTADIERRIRLAQADDSLAELRRQLRMTSGLWNYKSKQVGASQKVSTRARSLIDRFNEKTMRCAERYRAARAALLTLDPTGSWQTRLQDLKKEHVRGPSRDPDEAEGTRELSWIWLVERQDDMSRGDEQEISDSRSFSINVAA